MEEAAGNESDLTASALFDSFMRGVGVEGIDLIGAPGQPFFLEPRPGDILCRRGEGGLSHTAIIAVRISGLVSWP